MGNTTKTFHIFFRTNTGLLNSVPLQSCSDHTFRPRWVNRISFGNIKKLRFLLSTSIFRVFRVSKSFICVVWVKFVMYSCLCNSFQVWYFGLNVRILYVVLWERLYLKGWCRVVVEMRFFLSISILPFALDRMHDMTNIHTSPKHSVHILQPKRAIANKKRANVSDGHETSLAEYISSGKVNDPNEYKTFTNVEDLKKYLHTQVK